MDKKTPKKKLKTIKLQGKDYVQVQERVRYFNETYKNGLITAKPSFLAESKTVMFEARVTPDIEKKERTFVGHSFGTLGKEKALEKLETVAVGRALAFMGIGIIEGIASADEMQRFTNKETGEVFDNNEQYSCSICQTVMKMSKASNLYCPNEYGSHKGQKGEPIEMPKKELSEKDQKFLDSLPEEYYSGYDTDDTPR